MDKDSHKAGKAALFVVVSSLMFGSYGIYSKLIGKTFETFFQSWTRALIICLILLPILFFRKEFVVIERKDWNWLAVFLVFTSLTVAPIFYAFNHMDIGSAYLLFFVGMLITMYLVGFLFHKERVTLIKIIALLVAGIGLYMVFSFSVKSFTLFAALMALLNGVASGGEIAFSKKLSGSYSPLYLSWLSYLAILITNGITSFAIGEIQHLPSLDIVWLYHFIYVITGVLGFWLVLEGMRHLESSVGSLLTTLEAVFGVLFGIIVFGEILTFRLLAGGLLIIFAAALPHLYRMRYKKDYSLAATSRQET